MTDRPKWGTVHEETRASRYEEELSSGLSGSDSEEGTRQLETSHLILEAAGEGIYGLDLEGFVTFVNPAAVRMTGWSLEELRGHTQHSVVHHSHGDGSHYPREDCPIYQALRDGRVHHREDEVFWRKDGSSFPVSYTSTPILRNGEPVGAVIVFRDITTRLREQAWEHKKSELFTSILAQDPLEKTASLLSEAFEELHPATRLLCHVRRERKLVLVKDQGSMVGVEKSLDEVLISADSCACGRAAFWGREQVWSGECRCPALDTDYQQSLPLLSAAGEVLGTLSIFFNSKETTFEKVRPAALNAAEFARLALEHGKLQQRLRYQAQHDLLTNLPNRMMLQDRLDQALVLAKSRQTRVGVCFIDLDRFKQVNDVFGHGAGDEYLKKVTANIKANCREIDTLARQGGDEFILLLPEVKDAQDVERLAGRLLESIRMPFFLEGAEFVASASIGISIYPEHGAIPSVLLQNADTALYGAKRDGRNRAVLYQERFGSETREHAWLCAGLQQALVKRQFHLVFQPMYSSKQELTGFETLLRWEHPVEGQIVPDRFIPIAEETGLIVPIGEWVLREACRQAVLWQRIGDKPISMAVNVSGVQVGQKDFVQVVQTVLRDTQLPPELLHLEITETWVVADARAAAGKLKELRHLGVKISIDDFGTGHSSFGCLHDLPLDTLKIDRSFIARLDGTARQLSTVRAIVALAHQLGLKTVAEGIETQEQLEQLQSIDCDLLQGFLMAKPLSVERANQLVRKRRQKDC